MPARLTLASPSGIAEIDSGCGAASSITLLGNPLVRYPRSGFVSADELELEMRPQDRWPHMLGLAWSVTESNRIGAGELY